jgi:RimJ/RimL family protein N-acetyltransferase
MDPLRDVPLGVGSAIEPAACSDWRARLPVLAASEVVLRELRRSDAAALYAALTTEEVSRFISPPPTTIDGFERFIEWTHAQRAAGVSVCFAVTIRGFDTPIGLFQVRARELDFSIAEWGFAIASPFWGTGVFPASAQLVMTFVFETLEATRLEARAVVANGRGRGALLKVGAVKEGVLRRSFRRDAEVYDQILFTILAEDWRARRAHAGLSASVN